MSISPGNSLLSRIIAIGTCMCLAYSSTALGLHSIGESASSAVRQYLRRAGQYTDTPRAPFLGARPSRDPKGRGGVWTKAMRDRLELGGNPLYAGLSSTPFVIHTLAVAAEPGSAYPWEGSVTTSGGSVNTGNGNKLTKLSLVSWKARGGMTVDFTLYHNSQTNYDDELGYGWTWTYDIYINNLTGNPVVHWGDGLSVPFTAPSGGGGTGGGSSAGSTGGGGADGGEMGLAPPSAPAPEAYFDTTYTAPAGIYDTLVKKTDNTWELTKKNGTKYLFNTAGFCTAIQDRNGNQITLTLNSQNYCTQITDPSGRYISISVSSNKFTQITDPSGKTWSFTINGSGDLSTVTWPTLDNTSHTDGFSYSSHRITSHTDRRGKIWSNTYNTDGSLASETDPLNHTWSYSYSSSATTITDPLSHTETHNYSSGKLASIQDESSYSESYTARNSNNQVTTLVDKRGKTWTYTYDSKGNVLTATDPLSHTDTFTYNGFSQVLTAENHLGHETSYSYDSYGNLLTVTDPLSHVVETNTYGTYGLRATTKNALNHQTNFTYNSNGDLTEVEDPLDHATTMAYNSMSQVTSVTDALTNDETIAYDNWHRPVLYTHDDSSTKAITYNAVDQVTIVTDELSHTTTYAYDDAGRLTSVTNGKGDVESYGYDNANRRTSVTNGRNKTRNYTYTNRGEVSGLTMPDSTTEAWSYNGNGDTTAYTNGLSQVIYFAFDDAGRQTGIDYPTGTDVSFGYDNADRRTSMVDSTGTTSWTYDNDSRVTALSTPQGNLSYGYDNANRRTSMTDSTGTTSYSYDNASRMASLTNPHSEVTTWTYDDANRATRQTFSSGAYSDFGYDSRSRQTSVTHKQSGGTTISSESYVYDDAGNLTSKTVDSVTTTYGYDNADQLTSESRTGYSASYTYDGNGNRASKTLNGTTETYVNDDGDKLDYITSGGVTVKDFSYDACGRTTSVVTSAGTTTLSYDYESRITQITYPNSSTNTFTYNGLDTRVGKVDSAGTHTYRRDGVSVTASVLSDGFATYTPGVSERRGGVTTFDLPDRLGTFSKQISVSGSTTSSILYDSFGNLISASGSQKGPFGFAGKYGYEEDTDSGLQLTGHRYYNSLTGRFLTRDPSRDGRNWYTYCENNPLRIVDPTGLSGQGLLAPPPEQAPSWIPREPTQPGNNPSGPGGGGGGAPAFINLLKGGLILGLILLPSNVIPEDPWSQMPPSAFNPIPKGHPLKSPYPPQPGWEWRGDPGGPSTGKGSWYNPQTGEILHPHKADDDHPEDHWDYTDPTGHKWRIDPKTGKKTPKERRGKQKKTKKPPRKGA